MASNREERLQMRQRGAASRHIKQVDFGFSFGLAPPPTDALESSAADVGIASGPAAPPQPPSAPETTLPEKNDATSPHPAPAQRTPGSARNALPERPSMFDIPPDEPSDVGRSSKRRKIDSPNLGSRSSLSRDSYQRETQGSQTLRNGTKSTTPALSPGKLLHEPSATTADQNEVQLAKESPSTTAPALPDETAHQQSLAHKSPDTNKSKQKSPARQPNANEPNGTDPRKGDGAKRKGRGSSADKISPSRAVAQAKSAGKKTQESPPQGILPENPPSSASGSASPGSRKEPDQTQAGPAKRKTSDRKSLPQRGTTKQRTRNDKRPSLEAVVDNEKANGTPEDDVAGAEDRTLPQKQKANKPEKRAGRAGKKPSQATEPVEETSPPAGRGKRKRREVDQTQEEGQEPEPESQPTGRGKRKQKQPTPPQAVEEEQEPVSQSAGIGKRKRREVEQQQEEQEPELPRARDKGKKKQTEQVQEPEPQPLSKGKKKQRQMREPEPEKEDEPEQDNSPGPSPASRHRRGGPSKSKNDRRTQPGEREPQGEAEGEGTTRTTRKPRQPRGETVPVTVHRLVNVGSLTGALQAEDLSDEEESADELATTNTKLPNRGGVNAADVLGQICRETLEKTLNTLKNGITNETNAARRAEWTRKKKAVEAFGTELEGRLFELSEMLDSNFVLGVKLKKAKREMMDMRSRLYQIRKEREGVALQMDAVRRKHSEEENTRMARTTINNSLHSLDLALERSQKPDDNGSSNPSPTAGLEFMLRSVAETVSSRAPGAQGGLLHQIKSFNAQLEAAARRLESNS